MTVATTVGPAETTMAVESIETMGSLWPAAAVGTAIALAATWAGWLVARYPSFGPVRGIAWWVNRVVAPLVMTPSWRRRTVYIFANNVTILGGLVAVGPWTPAAIMGAATLGMTLGIALRVIAGRSWSFAAPRGRREDTIVRWKVRLGLTLNLLEPPAIALALGISIARGTVPLDAATAWAAFGMWVAPPMLIAAAGESLWLGAGMELQGVYDRPHALHDAALSRRADNGPRT